MNWDAIGAIGEIVGAGAVVLTLIYLSIQLRQNTEALRSTAWQAIQDSEHEFDLSLAHDPQALAVFLHGMKEGMDSFDDPVEGFQFFIIGKQLIDHYQKHHYQY